MKKFSAALGTGALPEIGGSGKDGRAMDGTSLCSRPVEASHIVWFASCAAAVGSWSVWCAALLYGSGKSGNQSAYWSRDQLRKLFNSQLPICNWTANF